MAALDRVVNCPHCPQIKNSPSAAQSLCICLTVGELQFALIDLRHLTTLIFSPVVSAACLRDIRYWVQAGA